MLFRETNTVYSETHMKHINTLCGQNAVLACYGRWYMQQPLGFKGFKGRKYNEGV
jgi:hypothetical protein